MPFIIIIFFYTYFYRFFFSSNILFVLSESSAGWGSHEAAKERINRLHRLFLACIYIQQIINWIRVHSHKQHHFSSSEQSTAETAQEGNLKSDEYIFTFIDTSKCQVGHAACCWSPLLKRCNELVQVAVECNLAIINRVYALIMLLTGGKRKRTRNVRLDLHCTLRWSEIMQWVLQSCYNYSPRIKMTI